MYELKLKHRFDPQKNRHYLNNKLTVLHCHHYATLFTQLGLDAKELVDGTRILKESIEDVYFEVLSSYFTENNVTTTEDRIEICKQMFSSVGMGRMDIVTCHENGGEIELPFAYVDEGWLKKWGKHQEPVNYIGMGYISGMFSAVFDKPTRTFKVNESQSKVMGADKSIIKVST